MPKVQDILLIGGGHAHVAVLADWARNGLPAQRAALLTQNPTLRYSGMVPGWISGEHTREAGVIDLAGLAKAAGVELILDRCVAMDPASRKVLSLETGLIAFGLASIDVGGAGQASRVLGKHPRLLDVRPIDRFVADLEKYEASTRQIAVIGGGAGGVELAFALSNRDGSMGRRDVTLIAGQRGLLPDFSKSVRDLVRRELKRQKISISDADARIEGGVLLAGEIEVSADLMVAAIGPGATDWPKAAGMAVDEAGFIAVDRFQRSISHSHVFAAGDCARRMDRPVVHAGVHAVHAGPVLAANLRAALRGYEPYRSYTPRPASLYLLSTGNGAAIASYGRLAAQGRWAARLKAWIDKRWIASYARLIEDA